MEAWGQGGISTNSPLLRAKSCPFAFPALPVLPAEACALEHEGIELPQQKLPGASGQLSLWSEKVVSSFFHAVLLGGECKGHGDPSCV